MKTLHQAFKLANHGQVNLHRNLLIKLTLFLTKIAMDLKIAALHSCLENFTQ